MIEIQGVVDRVVYHNDENGYTVAYINYSNDGIDTGNYEETAVIGYFPSIAEGELLKIRGEYVYNTTYGRQLKMKTHYKVIPSDATRTRKLLAGGLFSGIGPYTAGKIVETFGDNTMKVLESRSVKVLDVPGVGTKTAEKIWSALDIYSGKLDIIRWMVDYGFSNAMINKITRWFKDSSITRLRTDPYQLTYISGIGFNKADAFAKWTGIEEDHPTRVIAGAYHLLSNDEHGHTFLPTDELWAQTNALLGTNLEKAQFMKTIIKEAKKEKSKLVARHHGVHPSDLWYAEEEIAAKLIKLSDKRTLFDEAKETQLQTITKVYEQRHKLNLNDLQKHAVLRAAIEGVSILTGGPGTGKTLTIGAIINYYQKRGMSFKLCAPTGRAAKRMTETIGHEAFTIHRLLEFSPAALGRFTFNEDNQLPIDLVIVDEISMVDVRLMRSLLAAIDPERTSVVFIGDENQLPSIGPGNVLKDMIASDKIAFTRLAELYRQSATSLIVRNAHLVNHGLSKLDSGGRGKDFIWHPDVTPSMVVKTVAEYIPTHYGINTSDVIVLSPIRKAAGELNVNNVNALLQARLNPNGVQVPSSVYDLRIGDKVVHNENDYTKGIGGIFNGDIGMITRIEPGSTQDKGMFYVDYYGEEIAYEITEGTKIELARAISIHRSQGGEYDAVVIVLPDTYIARKLLSRNLLYTAITRSRKLCILLGKEEIVKQAIANNVVARRNTWLREQIDYEFRRSRKGKTK